MEDNKFTGQSLAQEQQSSGKSTQNAPLKDVRPEVPLSQYRESTGRPYAVEFFQIDNWNELNDFTDINDMRDKVSEIDNYLQRLRATRGLENKLSVYESLVADMEAVLGIEKDTDIEVRLDKLYNYIQMSKKAQLIERTYGRLSR